MKNPKMLSEILRKLTINAGKGKPWDRSQASRALKVLDLLGHGILVTEINETHVEHLVSTLEERGVASSTINRYLASLSKMLKYAFKRQSIYHMERMPYIEWYEESEGRDRYLTQDEEQEIIQLLTNWNMTDYLELFLVLLDTGMRLNEALSFKKAKVTSNEVSTLITLDGAITKNGHKRGIPLTQRAKGIVLSLCKNCASSDKVFGHLNYWRAENIWRKLRKEMDLQDDKDFVIHSLRHTCATRLAQSGKVELHLIGKMLGHRSWKMINKYAHLIPNNLMGAIGILNNINKLSDNG